MTVEAASFISELNPAWPDDNDPIPEGDNHVRVVKLSLQNQFPNFIAAAVNPTVAELNYSVGVTSLIQAQIDATVAATSTNAVNIGTNDTDIAALQAKDVTQDGRLDAIETEQTTQNGRLTATEAATTTNAGDIATNAGDIATNAGDIVTIEAEQVVQNSRLTALEGINLLPAGTRMLFRQASTPTGWTLVADADDRVIRNRSTTGGGTGGSWTISGITVDGHAVTAAEMPAHTHTGPSHSHGAGGLTVPTLLTGGGSNPAIEGRAQGAEGSEPVGGSTAAAGTGATGSAGSGSTHTHGQSTSDGVWRPAYIDVITGSKD